MRPCIITLRRHQDCCFAFYDSWNRQ